MVINKHNGLFLVVFFFILNFMYSQSNEQSIISAKIEDTSHSKFQNKDINTTQQTQMLLATQNEKGSLYGVQNLSRLSLLNSNTNIYLEKSINLDVSIGYIAPIQIINSIIRDNFNSPIFPVSFSARVKYIFLQKDFGYLGVEFAPNWSYISNKFETYTLSANLFESYINAVYQTPFILNNLFINARAGVGISSFLNMYFDFGNGLRAPVLDTWFPSVDLGASVQWYIYKRLFIDIGFDFKFHFSNEMLSAYLNPVIFIGWHF